MSEVAFTPDQLAAVDVSRRNLDTCITAGPGSGKTTVLVEHFRRLVADGVDPLRILAITFTEKAAGNMRGKLSEAYRDDSRIRARLERAWVSTVHGFCERLLKENAVLAGIDPQFGVADERESWRMQQESMAAAMDALLAERPAAVAALIRDLAAADFEEAALAAYDAMRGAGTRIEDLGRFPAPPGVTLRDVARKLEELRREPAPGWSAAQRDYLADILQGAERIVASGAGLPALEAIAGFSCSLTKCKRGNGAYELVRELRDLIEESKRSLITGLFARERELLVEVLRHFDTLYRERKRQAGMLDFADLEEFTVRLLEERPETRERLREQFDHVLMDEFQDTNGQQARLIDLVRPPGRFYAVGDINQSIFGFRHAEPRGFRDYRDRVAQSGGRLVELTGNFRSRPEILSAVETVAAGLAGIEPRALVAEREFAEPRPVAVEAIAVCAADAAGALRIEAQWVARRIVELGGEFEFKDMAVLVRNTEVMADFTAAFDEAGIPYLVNRGKGFYETREINDLAHLLRVIANPRDEVSLATVLRSPLVGVTDEALLALKAEGNNIGAALARLGPETEGRFAPEDYRRLAGFRDRLRDWRVRREYVSFDRLLTAAMDDCGYRPGTGARGAANIDKFLAQARDASARMSLDEFVEESALVRAANPREPDAPPEDSANAVKLMTVHSAKGLEFPVVFVAALHKGVETNLPVLAFSPRIGLGARWHNPAAEKQDKDDLFQHAIREERRRREAEESNRLLYVAMTRAEQHLVLSFSGSGGKAANWAGVAAAKLGLDLDARGEEVLTRTAPDGKEWKLRFLSTDQPPAGDPFRPVPPSSEAGDAELVSPPAITGQQDANATVTDLAKFAACPREYYLGRYLGFSGRTIPGSTAVSGEPEARPVSRAEFGTEVHALLAGAAVPDPDPEAVRLAGVFGQSPLGRRVSRAARVEREFDFLMAVEGLVIRGQIDLWFEEGGEIGIVDYKTDTVSLAEAHQRAQEYALQLRLYAMAVEQVAGRPPDRAWLYFLRPNAAVEVDLSPSLLDSPEQAVRDFQEAQSKLEFPMTEGDRCRRCPFFRDLCPATLHAAT